MYVYAFDFSQLFQNRFKELYSTRSIVAFESVSYIWVQCTWNLNIIRFCRSLIFQIERWCYSEIVYLKFKLYFDSTISRNQRSSRCCFQTSISFCVCKLKYIFPKSWRRDFRFSFCYFQHKFSQLGYYWECYYLCWHNP